MNPNLQQNPLFSRDQYLYSYEENVSLQSMIDTSGPSEKRQNAEQVKRITVNINLNITMFSK